MYLNNYSVIQGWERASKRERESWRVQQSEMVSEECPKTRGQGIVTTRETIFNRIQTSISLTVSFISFMHHFSPSQLSPISLYLSLSCLSERFFLSFLSSFAPYFIHFSLQVLFFVTLTFSRLLLFSHSFRWCECIFGVLFMQFPHSCLILDPFSSSFLCLSWLMTGHYYY